MNSPISVLMRRFTQNRHLAPVMMVVFLGVLLTTLVSYFYTKRTVDTMAQGQLAQAMNTLDREVSLRVTRMSMMANLMSQEDVFRLSLEDSYLGRSARVAAQRKIESYARSGSFDRVHLVDMTGHLVLSSSPELVKTLWVSDRTFFHQASRGMFALDTLPVTRSNGRPALVAATPLRGTDGNIRGVVVLSTDTNNYVRETLNAIRIGTSGGAYILSAEGRMLAKPVWAANGAFEPGDSTKWIVSSADKAGIQHYERNGSHLLTLVHKNEATGWILVLEADESEVLAPARRLGAVSGTISFFTLALVALALGVLRRTINSLRISESDQRTLTDLSPVGIVTFNHAGQPKYLNTQARKILGLGPDAPLPPEIILEDAQGVPLASDASPIAGVLAQQRSVTGLLTWYTAPDGSRKALSLNATALGSADSGSAGAVAVLEDITERTQALELLRQSEERFSTLFQLSPDNVTLSELETGILVDVNERFAQTHGISRAEAIGKTIWELGVYADESQLTEMLENVRRDGFVKNFEARGRNSEGQDITLLISSQMVEFGGKKFRLAVARDITEHMQAVGRLKQSEERFASLFRLSPDSIMLTDMDSGQIVDVNESFTSIFGYTRAEVLGRKVQDLNIYKDDSQRQIIHEQIKRQGHVLNVVLPGRCKDGSEGVYLLSAQTMVIGAISYRMTVVRDITEQTRAVEQLRQSEKRFASLFRLSPDSVVLSEAESGIIVDVNEGFCQIHELAREQAIGRRIQEFGSFIDDDQMLEVQDNFNKYGYVKNFEMRGVAPSGREIILAMSSQMIELNGLKYRLTVARDITEQKRAVEQLRQSEERFSSLFRYSPEATVLMDNESMLLADVNEAFIQLSGYSAEELIGKSTHELGLYVNESTRDTLHAMLASDGRVDNYEFEARRKDGQILQCSMSSHIISFGGKSYVLSMVHDITDMKKMQAMMIQTEKMTSVGGIAAGMAHEINNPLGIVLQAAQNLAQRTRPDFPKNRAAAEKLGLSMDLIQQYMQARKLDVFIADIQDAAVRASNIIRHMLDFSRCSESRRKVCDLPSIIDKAIGLAGNDYDLKKKYDFKRIRIERDYADDLPIINCTETEIEQVLLNLLRNSAQALATANPPVAEPCISVRLSGDSGLVRIEVKDNGPGIPVEVQRRIFEPFYTTKQPGVGTGLGLSVSYYIVTKSHSGVMRVSSEPGQGTTFFIELPTETSGEEAS